MEIPRKLVSALPQAVQDTFKEIDLLINTYEITGKQAGSIDIWSPKWNAIEKALKKHEYSLANDLYRGYKINSKIKPKRYNKRKLHEFEVFH